MGLFRRSKTKRKQEDASAPVNTDSACMPRQRSWRRGQKHQEQAVREEEDDPFHQASGDESSFGDPLAPGDQFDLYVPFKVRPAKSILRNQGSFGRRSHHPHHLVYSAGQSSHYGTNDTRGELEETSTVSSVSFATLDNSLGGQDSIIGVAPLPSPKLATKATTKRKKKRNQPRDQPESTVTTTPEVAVKSPVSSWYLPWCGPVEENSKEALQRGIPSIAELSTSDRNGDTKGTVPVISHRQTKHLQTMRRRVSASVSDMQSKLSSRYEYERSTCTEGALSSNKNNEINTTKASSNPATTRTKNGSCIFPTSFLSGSCGPQEVSEEDIADHSLTAPLPPRSMSSHATIQGAFREYERPSESPLFIRRDASLFDTVSTDDDADDTSQGPQRSPGQNRHKSHHHSGDQDSVPTYDDEGQTAISVMVHMGNSEDDYYGWVDDDDDDGYVDEDDDGRDDDSHQVRNNRPMERGDGTSGWKLRLPKVRSIPKLGNLARARSFQRSWSRGRSNSRGRDETAESQVADVTTTGRLTSDPRRRRSRSRSRGRTSSFMRSPSKTAVKDRRNKVSTGREIEPMDLV